jgi:uncharacterized delta-60 repeat protein
MKHLSCFLRWSRGLAVLLGTTALLAGLPLLGQTPDTFNPNVNGTIYAMAVQPDGRTLVGGSFTTVGGLGRTNLARVNTDGTPDRTFMAGADGTVYSIALQEDGGILVAGAFTSFGGQIRNRLARLRPDGAVDSAFDPNPNDTVYSMVVESGGNIVAGGNFTTIAGVSATRLARLKPDGTSDGTFSSSANQVVSCLAIQEDGKILVGGFFGTLAGQGRANLGRIHRDGSLDADFRPTMGLSPGVLVLQADGRILVGGQFTSLGGVTRNRIGRLNADGSLDGSFDPSANNVVYALALQADGKILIGGQFTTIGGITCNRLGRLNADGSLDTTFNPGANGTVYAVALQADGKILAAGSFNLMGTQTRNRLARLDNTHSASESLSIDSSTLTWLRGNSSPDVWRASFDASTNNGLEWIALANAQRVAGGWTATPATLPSNATLRARGFVAGGGGSLRGSGSGSIVEAFSGAWAIRSHPIDRVATSGSTVTLSVGVWGIAPITYQWFKDGVSLADGGRMSGAKSAILTLAAVNLGDAGRYSVTVTTASGSASSLPALLTVLDPYLTRQPVSQMANAGRSVSFTAAAGGTAPLSYQWRKDGIAIGAATTATLTLSQVTWGDRGNYDVVVSNPSGSLTSVVASLSVNLAAPDIFPGLG